MTPAQVGAALAIAVVGWPLYTLVTSGDMDATTAVLRGGVVVVACIYGVSRIVDMVNRFEAEMQTVRRKRLNDLFSDMAGAVSEGSLVDPDVAHPDTAASAQGGPAPSAEPSS